MPRQSSSWSKELDVRFVRAVREELSGGPSEGVVRHQETSEGGKTVIPWDSILSRLRSSTHWPEDINTTDDLKRRWDMTYRVWYARAGLFEADDPNKSRASVLRLSKLLDYLRNRDYELESKPGRRKSTTPVGKRKENGEKFEEEESDEHEPSGEEGDDEEDENQDQEKEVASPKHFSSPPQATPPKKRTKMETTPVIRQSVSVDPRLEPWLEFLSNPKLVKTFRIHSHSEVVLEPQLLLDHILSGKNPVGASNIILFARAITPSAEWAKRVVDVADEKMIGNLLSEKVSFFLFSPKPIHLSGQKLLFSLVFFPSHQVTEGDSQAYLWTLFQDLNSSGLVPASKSLRVELLKSLGLPQDGLDEIQFRNEVITSTASPLLLALARFHDCLTKLIASKAPRVMDIWPGEERVKNELLSAMLLSPHVSIRAAPFIEPPALPFKSILEAVTTLIAVDLPSWFNGFSPERRDALLSALRDTAKTVVLIASLKKLDQSFSWNRKPDEQEVLVLLEEAGQFGGLLRLTKLTATSATLSILLKASSMQSLHINHRAYPLAEHFEHQVEFQPSLQISVALAGNVKVSLLV